MPKPRTGANRLDPRRTKKSNQPSHAIARSHSGRLHLALLVALAVVGVAVMAFPLTRPRVRADDPSGTPVLVVAGGLSAALHSQAETVVSALSQAEPAPTPQDPASSQSLDEFGGASLVPRPLLVTAAYMLVWGALAGPEGQEGPVTEMGPPVRFTLHEGGFPSEVFSTRPNVGSALNALGADYSDHDLVWPQPETLLTAGKGGNSNPNERAAWMEIIKELKPREAHIFSIDRPPAIVTLKPIAREMLDKWAREATETTGIPVRAF